MENSLTKSDAEQDLTQQKVAQQGLLNKLLVKLQMLRVNRPRNSDTTETRTLWWHDYNFSQLCYFLAFLILVSQLIFSSNVNLIVPGFVAFVGLLRELLNVFQRLWSTTLGKSLILILYAATANISIAYSALQINQITGVEPTSFVFTLGFTTLVLLPFWLTIASTLFFGLAMVVANVWLIVRLPLRLVGIKTAIHWEDRRRPLLTMLLRIILIPIVLVSMFHLTTPYFSNVYVQMPFEVAVVDKELPADERALAEIAETPGVKNMLAHPSVQARLSEEEKAALNEQLNELDSEAQKIEEKSKTIGKVIAVFLYNLEAYPHSKCLKREDQRSAILDENLALMITQNPASDYGYDFEVVSCEPRVANAS
ncbi:hypothetical protein [Alteromonas flava]|uniref:hypothetical protein n=1 Tax=Alteromonas flava TaxID=2048003 RepID=UPI000C281E88|nr:hypothetical protein [Alteromonas flava]